VFRWLIGSICVFALLAGSRDVSALSKRGGSSKGSHSARAARPRVAKPSGGSKPRTTRAPRATKQPASQTGVARNNKGRIQRSAAARHAFARQTGYPNGRPGYVIDHIKPLACGGADAPSNMQWQTIAAGKAKDKVERMGCR
jgi:hypothetical protein